MKVKRERERERERESWGGGEIGLLEMKMERFEWTRFDHGELGIERSGSV